MKPFWFITVPCSFRIAYPVSSICNHMRKFRLYSIFSCATKKFGAKQKFICSCSTLLAFRTSEKCASRELWSNQSLTAISPQATPSLLSIYSISVPHHPNESRWFQSRLSHQSRGGHKHPKLLVKLNGELVAWRGRGGRVYPYGLTSNRGRLVAC